MHVMYDQCRCYNGLRGKWLQLTTSSGEITLGGERDNCNADACAGGKQRLSSSAG
jgi:hypothetical protein